MHSLEYRFFVWCLLLTLNLLLTSCGGGGTSGSTSPVTPEDPVTWTWVSGSSVSWAGNYGAKGVPSPSNDPGPRYYGASWADKSGNLWLLGGQGCNMLTATASLCGMLNDLWEYNPTTGNWVWMNGSNQNTSTAGNPPNSPSSVWGVYGTMGVPGANNTPGARVWAVTWSDNNGNFWLFGGLGIDASGNPGALNDLWKYSPVNNLWTWIGGSNQVNVPGSYGTKGVAATGNIPGARAAAAAWTDASGDFWLFGGSGMDSTNGSGGNLNDLWIYSPSANTWTWVSGSSTVNGAAQYGTKGVASASNIPGARWDSVSWIDGSGNFWLFGGIDVNQNGLNDLWKFDPSNKTWTWVSGSSTSKSTGNYGTRLVPAASNEPPARAGAVGWTDANGNLWLFGGNPETVTGDALNDLWEYASSTGSWTWISGSNTPNAMGDYGTKGVAAASNVPRAREGAFSWTDSAGRFWLMGSSAIETDATGQGMLNDLWRWQPQ